MTNVELEKARLRRTEKGDRRKSVIGIGSALLVLFGFVGFLNLIDSVNLAFRATQGPVERFLYWLVIATLGFIGPYGFYVAKLQREIKLIERRLPDFLRDVAEAGRFGMTLAEAIVVSSGGRYGKLTPEIKKMAAQITWGVPATEARRPGLDRRGRPEPAGPRPSRGRQPNPNRVLHRDGRARPRGRHPRGSPGHREDPERAEAQLHHARNRPVRVPVHLR